ncbi:hypothetical protein ACQPW1_09900 [Nocardia sp. CA-128927]|uniref:hypothetical protein n=1 Tax=Nocardia sp. CA-128927 TaxID=3239975 RepID=UPI003D958667
MAHRFVVGAIGVIAATAALGFGAAAASAAPGGPGGPDRDAEQRAFEYCEQQEAKGKIDRLGTCIDEQLEKDWGGSK